MSITRPIVIHQALHGYKEGHTLLASSLDISIEEKREMSILSDYSGSGYDEEFSEYYTCYPLSKFYVIAKTWYAPEMPRPGTVWTHSLLFDHSILWMVKRIESIKGLFRRPTADFESYNRPILQDIDELSLADVHISESFFKISVSLYTSEYPLVILAKSAKDFEDDIFNIWLQQWPRLRRNFSFCTGSLSSRMLDRKYLDLQVIPISKERSLSMNERNRLSIFNPNTNLYPNEWKEIYTEANFKAVFNFMTEMGSDIAGSVNNFKILLSAYQLLVRRSDPSALFNFLVDLNLPAQEGLLLKNIFVSRIWSESNSDKFVVLEYLLSVDNLQGELWNYQKLVLFAFESNGLSAPNLINILYRLKDLEKTNDLQAILLNVDVSIWLDEIELYRDFAGILFRKNQKRFLSSDSLWKMQNSIRDFWLDIFVAESEIDIETLVNALLSRNVDDYAPLCYEAFGGSIVWHIVQWIANNNTEISFGWQFIVRENLLESFECLSEQLNFNSALLTLIPSISSPTDFRWKNVSETTLTQVLLKTIDCDVTPARTGVYTYFMISCINDIIPEKETVMELIFQPLHNDLEKSIFDANTWQRFQLLISRSLYELVELDFFSKHYKDRYQIPEWDRCEFLRRSLVACFYVYDLNLIRLLKIVTDPYTFKYIVDFCYEVKPLRKWLKPMISQIENAGMVNSFHYKVLRSKY